MSDNTNASWSNPLGTLSWSSIPSPLIQMNIVFISWAVLLFFISHILTIIVATIGVIITILCLLKFQWSFFTGKIAKDIIQPTLGAKDNPLINAKDAELATPHQLSGKVSKKKKSGKG